MTDAPNIAQHMNRVARELLGTPNKRLSKQTDKELRYGTNGSLSIDLAKGTFFDFETNEGGGVLDLIAREKNLTGKAAFEFMQQIGCDGLLPTSSAPESAKTNGPAKSKLVATFDYQNAEGGLVFQVLRYEPKDFRQRRPGGNGKWDYHGGPPLPYRLPQLLEAVAQGRTIFIVEGERKVDALAKWNVPATCNAGGAKKWKPEHSAFLSGAEVVILPDNDEPGRAHLNIVGTALQGIAASVRVLELPGLNEKGDVINWIEGGGTAEQFWQLVETKARPWTAYPDEDAAAKLTHGWKYHSAEAPKPPRWLIKDILPETGAALMAGQWGTFKTTTALDLSVCVMTELPFAGRYRVKRRGAVLYLALEGEGAVQTRLSAIAGQRGIIGPLPFAWRGDCPALMDKNATDVLCRLATEASNDLDRKFGLPVVLIWVDTLITAAGYESGEDSDTAAAQKVMNALRTISRRMGALVVGVDHFGKVVETGTRGSSAKEGAADTVLALLAERELSGGVKNTRLAVRKQRDGVSGFEIPFAAKMLETGNDDDGDPTTAPIIDWQAEQQTTEQEKGSWTKSLKLFRRVLSTTLATHGQNTRPFLDGPLVCACDTELVRSEFYLQYPTHGDEDQRKAARQKAFKRKLDAAQEADLIGVRMVGGAQLIWLAKPEATSPNL